MKNQSLPKFMLVIMILFAYMAIPSEVKAQDVYEEVDEMPVPPGGMDGWINHMRKNLKYPQAARDNKT